MSDDPSKTVIDEVANAMQTAVVLAARVRRSAGEQSDDAIKLEAAIDRAARALSKLKPEGGAR